MNKAELKAFAKTQGFRLVGIADPDELPSLDFYDWWLDQGFAADMHFLRRQRSRRTSLRNIHPNLQSVIVCALPFPGSKSQVNSAPEESSEKDIGSEAKSEMTALASSKLGKVAAYANGEDYHYVVREKLDAIVEKLDSAHNVAANQRSLAYVDTGAIPERSLGVLAGIGWIGKNSMLIHPEEGSWFWLGEILSSVRFEPDLPLPDRCGTCRRCIDACPTDAIIEGARTVDSRKCISYLTIEHKGDIPSHFHEPMGEWLLGCDICQDVCPWNQQSTRKARRQDGPPATERLPISELLTMQEPEFKKRFHRRAHTRPKLSGLQRNAKIVLENLGKP